MKKVTLQFCAKFSLILFCLVFPIHGCMEEEFPASIQFEEASYHVAEGSFLDVFLVLDRAPTQDGSIEILLEGNTVYGQHFTTNPAAIESRITANVHKGDRNVKLRIRTIDNSTFDGGKYILLRLSNPSGSIRFGKLSLLTIEIDDDEGPSIVNFTGNSKEISEADVNGFSIQIQLSSPAKGDGSVTVSIHEGLAAYGTEFTTDPVSINGSVTLPITQGQTSILFNVLPVNDDLFTGNSVIMFLISKVSGIVRLGNSVSYQVTINDDEEIAIATFANSSGVVDENNGSGISIEVLLSNPAAGTGTIKVGFNNVYGEYFTTDPPAINNLITLNVNQNQVIASFKVLPVNNSVTNFPVTTTFTIASCSGVVVVGQTSTGYNLTIVDDEQTFASFEEGSGTINENAGSGISVKVNFSRPLTDITQIRVSGANSLANGSYGGVYYTDPEMSYEVYYDCDPSCWYPCYCPIEYRVYHLSYVLSEGSTSVTFKIVPVNNLQKEGTRILLFSLYTESPVQIVNGTYQLTILDDD